MTLVRTPGRAFEYSNVNYTVLGLVVQMVSGQRYESYIQENVFDPLEMRHCFTSLDKARQNGMSTGYATLFGLPIAKDVMHQPLVSTGTPGASYGMGWVASPVNGVPAIWHDGDNANYSSNLMMAPQAKLGIVVLENANSTFVLQAPNQIAAGVEAILLGKQPQSYERPAQFSRFVASTGIPALLSLVWGGWMAIAFVRRQEYPIPARRGFRWWMWVIGVPAFVDLILLVVIPKQWGMSLNTMAAAWYPDCFLLLFSGASLVAVWGVVRPALSLRWARNASCDAHL